MAEKENLFRISFDRSQQVLKLHLWGFWAIETSQEFLREFIKIVQTERLSEKEWSILADVTRFLPQRKEILPLLSQVMRLAKQHGVKKAARLVDNTITQMQIGRLSWESHFPENAFFQSEDAAIRWLREGANV